MTFKVINTQEEFDEAIKARLARESEKYKGYTSPEELQKIKDGYEEKLKAQKNYEGYTSPEELANVKKGYETEINGLKMSNLRMKVAQKNKLPSELADRLQGNNEEELQKDAESMSKLIGNSRSWPSAQSEPPIGDDKTEVKKLLSQFRED